MITRARLLLVVTAVAPLAALAAACIDDPKYGAVAANNGGVVFTDAFGAGVDYAAFKGSKLDALSIDATQGHSGRASLKVTVPATDDASGGFAGGAFITSDPRNLSVYDALTFWAKASVNAQVDAVGLGNDNTGTSQYTAQTGPIAVGTDWQKFTIPIPLAAKLVKEKGLFFYAVSAKGASPQGPFTMWLDDVQFETLGPAVLGTPVPQITAEAATLTVGKTTQVHGAGVSVPVNGSAQAVVASNGYFDFTSSSADVASVSPAGGVTALALGSSTITAALGGVPAQGALTVNVVGQDDSVIALLSGKYASRPVEKWLADWSSPAGQVAVSDAPDGPDPMKTYTNVQFLGVEFLKPADQLDLTQMKAFHVDLKTPDSIEIHFKLVDFGENGIVDPPTDGTPHGDDAQGEVFFNQTTSPAIVPGQWVSIDLPFSAFQVAYGQSPGLKNRAHVAQLVLAGPASGKPLISTVSIKNLYFHK